MDKLYSVTHSAELVGVTRRQVDYWIKIGLVEPTQTVSRGKAGKTYLFDFDGLFQMRILAALISSGVSTQALRKMTEVDNETRDSLKLYIDFMLEKFKRGDLDEFKLLMEHGFFTINLRRLHHELRDLAHEQLAFWEAEELNK